MFLGRGDSKSEGREEGKHVGSLRNTKLSFEDNRGPMMDRPSVRMEKRGQSLAWGLIQH